MDYQTCLSRLEKVPSTQQNQILSCNIQGNLGLAMLQLHHPDGKTVFEGALNQIREQKG
jgi:hypothetical protein